MPVEKRQRSFLCPQIGRPFLDRRRVELLAEIRALRDLADVGEARELADDLLLVYIDDIEVTEAYYSLVGWRT